MTATRAPRAQVPTAPPAWSSPAPLEPSRVHGYELALVAGAAALGYAALHFGRGLDVPDEGLLLHVAERLAAGQVPYRDVYFIYTPGFQYLLALLFKLFGPSLLAERVLLAAVHVGLVTTVYALGARLAWRPLALLAAAIVMATGVTAYRTLAALLTLAVLVRFVETGQSRWLAATGLGIGVSYLVGQEIGLYTGAATGAYLALASLRAPERRAALRQLLRQYAVLGAAVAAVLAPWIAILAAQGALAPMLDDTLRVTFLDQPRYMHVPLPPLLPLVPDDLSAQVVWGPPPYLLYVKLMIYLPLVAVAAAAGVLGAWWRVAPPGTPLPRALPLALLAAAMLGTLGFRADYYHLRQVLPVYLVLLAWLLDVARHGGSRRWRRWAAAGLGVAPLLGILLVSGSEALHERARLSAPLVTPRGTVLVDATTAGDLGALLRDLAERTAPGEPIYVAPAETAIYFLADRPNPTRYGQLVSTELRVLREDDGREQRALIAAVEAAGVRWVVRAPTDNVNGYPFAAYAPLIAAYLEAQYVPVDAYGYWSLLRRRD